MNILRRLPFSAEATTFELADQSVANRPYQVVVWVSLGIGDFLPSNAVRLPAILDTGHNHNFSIRANQLAQWAGIHRDQCTKVGAILVNGMEVPLLAVNLWVYRNRPGTSDLLPNPVRLAMPEGISVYTPDLLAAPRLPLLGLRGLVRNDCRLTIEGMSVSLTKRVIPPKSVK